MVRFGDWFFMEEISGWFDNIIGWNPSAWAPNYQKDLKNFYATKSSTTSILFVFFEKMLLLEPGMQANLKRWLVDSHFST